MKSLHSILLTGTVLITLAFAANPLQAQRDLNEVAAHLLDTTKTTAERAALVEAHAGQAAVILEAMVKGLKPGTPEEYKRISAIWQVTVAAGKRNEAHEIRHVLAVALPQPDAPLLDWQAVVIGGGIINGLGLAGHWPGDRIEEILQSENQLKVRWNRALDLAAAMADNEKTPTGTRYDALRMIALEGWEKRGAQLVKYLARGVNAELQQGAVSGLADIKSPHVAPALLSAIPYLSDHNRNFALDALLRDDTRTSALLDAVAAKRLDPALIGDSRIAKVKSHDNARIRARAEKLFYPVASEEGGAVYSVGLASVDVTPGYPVRLSGYLARNKPSEGVIQRLFAKALAIGSDKESPALLLTVDNVAVPEHMRDELLKRLAKKGITSEKFAICSSHTHSAPKLAGILDNIFGKDISPEDQSAIDRYTAELTDHLEKASLAALKNRKPGHLSWAKTSASFAHNRRTKGGPVDHEVPVLKVTGADGSLRGLLANYACHCTTLGPEPNEICGDWAGYAQEFLEASHPGATVLVAIGCGADSNPQPRPGVEHAKKHGQELTDAINALLKKPFTPLTGQIQGHARRIQLPFDKHPTRQEFEERAKKDDATGYHARKNLARLDRGESLPTHLPYLVQTWNFGDELAMVFLPGEVVVDYSLRIKKEFDRDRLWVNAYANDVPCYIPSRRIWTEGGYEGAFAMIYYDRPTRFAENVEDIIFETLHELMPRSFVFDEKTAEFPPPKSPEDSLRTIRTKPGMVVELVATEPQIVDPVAVDFGTDGKLWVLEMHDYPTGMDGNFKPGGRLKLLEDKDGDGRYEKSTLFLDDLLLPTGLMAWRNGVLICTAPDILYAEDTNGDGKADMVKKLFTGFATHNYQARVNSLRWGLDNWVHGSGGLFGGKIKSELTGKEITCTGRDFRMNPDTGEFEAVHGSSQQGRTRDDWDNWFGGNNSHFIWHYPLPDRYVRRNPFITTPDPKANIMAKEPDYNVLYPISRTLERFNNPNSANRTTSASGLEIYRDQFLGADAYGSSFAGETVHNLVRRFTHTPDGVTFEARRAPDEQKREFLASTDNWFRPVEVRTAPDGSLWIVDMYRFVIEHPVWIPAERLAKLDVRAGDDKGRIFRVHEKGKALRNLPNLTTLPSKKLVALLDTPNGTQRDLIHRELYHRQDKSVAKPLKDLALKSTTPAVRAQALAVLDGIDALAPEDTLKALDDEDPRVRRNAIRMSELFLSGGRRAGRISFADHLSNPAFPLLRDRLLELVNDPDFAVRYQLALSLGEWNDLRAGKPLAELATKDAGDGWMRAAILTSATRYAPEILSAVLSLDEKAPGRSEMITQLIATAAGSDKPGVFESALIAIAPEKNQEPALWHLTVLNSVQESLERRKHTLNDYSRSPNPKLRDAVERIRLALDNAAVIAGNAKAALADREAALKLLGWSSDEKNLKILISVATEESNARLQKAAHESLRRLKHPQVAEKLLANWRGHMLSVRGNLLELLLSREEWIHKVLDAVQQGKIIPTEIPPVNRQALLVHASKEISRRAIALFPQHQSRKEVLARYTGVSKMIGHIEKGAEVFAQSCASCHTFRNQGTAVGPDLSPLGDKSPDDFIVAILDPNAVIEPRFVQYNVELKDDRSLSGVISAETATSITLVMGGGAKEKILRTDIADLRPSNLSLMPEGLEESINPEAMADLIAFLKHRPGTFGGGSPEQASQSLKQFVGGGVNGLRRVVSAAETIQYPSWLGPLPLAHCRQSDGNSKVIWETDPAPATIDPNHIYTFRLPAAMGHLSQPVGKFQLKFNGTVALDFDVTLNDRAWAGLGGKLTLRYQVMEYNTEDSNGILTLHIKGELLEALKPVTIEVTGTDANSRRWFGVYQLDPAKVASN